MRVPSTPEKKVTGHSRMKMPAAGSLLPIGRGADCGTSAGGQLAHKLHDSTFQAEG
jgi:hypothetical protein